MYGPMWPFLLMYRFHDMRHTGFRRLTMVNGTPGDRGVTMFESDKIMLTKNDAFVGMGYCNQGLFMLNDSEILNSKASSSSAYIVVSCDVGHGRLRHVNFSYIKKMVE